MLAKKKEKDIIDQLLDQIDFHGMTAEELAGENGLLKKLTSRFYSKALDAEMDEHLGYKKNDNAGDNSGNSRNGYTTKTVITDSLNCSMHHFSCIVLARCKLFTTVFCHGIIYKNLVYKRGIT